MCVCVLHMEVREHPSGVVFFLLSLNGVLGIELRANRMGSKPLNLLSHFAGPRVPQTGMFVCSLYSKLLWWALK